MIHTTTAYGIAYADDDTALADLAAATQQAAQTVEAALLRGGIAPPNAADLAAVTARVAALENGAWQTPTSQAVGNFGNGWSPLQFRKEGATRLRIRGAVGAVTITAGQTLFTLPIGFRPAANQFLPAGGSAGGMVQLFINSSGSVTMQPAGAQSFVLINGTIALD